MTKFTLYYDLKDIEDICFDEPYVLAEFATKDGICYLVADREETIDKAFLSFHGVEYPVNVKGFSVLQVFELMMKFRAYILEVGAPKAEEAFAQGKTLV